MTTTPLIVKTRKARKSPVAAALALAYRALAHSHCRDIAIKKRTERLTLEIEQMAAAGRACANLISLQRKAIEELKCLHDGAFA